jgi:two-component system NtrC family sensor kinase
MKSVRLRLLALAMLPLVVLLPILLIITMTHWASKFDGLLISKVASDLRIAEQYMQRIVTTQGNRISGLAASTDFRNAADAGPQELQKLLERSRAALGLDYLVLRHENRPSRATSERLAGSGARKRPETARLGRYPERSG